MDSKLCSFSFISNNKKPPRNICEGTRVLPSMFLTVMLACEMHCYRFNAVTKCGLATCGRLHTLSGFSDRWSSQKVQKDSHSEAGSATWGSFSRTNQNKTYGVIEPGVAASTCLANSRTAFQRVVERIVKLTISYEQSVPWVWLLARLGSVTPEEGRS